MAEERWGSRYDRGMRAWRMAAEMDGPASAAFGALRGALQRGGATVVEARQLGGLALVVRFECETSEVAPLVRALSAVARLVDGAEGPAPGRGEIVGALHVTLVGGGDERVEVPSVPG